ncbi:MAG TPA: hypothetical protein PKH36_07355 [Flavobacteriales bacterium]|nr:hypothetical protein [Flavobacteriales bacterium]HNK68521.1 hypothetical protein [Flavobacteriales bacterium]HNO07060.1 hypothetical protein [Flavobacteriales bacterium]
MQHPIPGRHCCGTTLRPNGARGSGSSSFSVLAQVAQQYHFADPREPTINWLHAGIPTSNTIHAFNIARSIQGPDEGSSADDPR